MTRFTEQQAVWQAAAAAMAELDVLMAFAEAAQGTGEGPMCRPHFLPENAPPVCLCFTHKLSMTLNFANQNLANRAMQSRPPSTCASSAQSGHASEGIHWVLAELLLSWFVTVGPFCQTWGWSVGLSQAAVVDASKDSCVALLMHDHAEWQLPSKSLPHSEKPSACCFETSRRL